MNVSMRAGRVRDMAMGLGFGYFFGFVCVVERRPVGKSGNELKKTRIMKIGQSVAAKTKHFPIYHTETVTQTTPVKKEKHSTPE